MSERRTVKTVIAYEVDKNSTRQVIASADAVENAVSDISKDFADLGPVAKAATAKIRLGFDGLKKDAKELDNRLESVEDSFESVGRAAKRAAQAGGQGGFRTSTESAGDLGSLLSATAGLDSLGGGSASRILGEAGQFGDVIEALGRLPSAFQDVTEAIGVGKTAGLIGVLGVVSVAAVALSIAFADVAKAQEEAAKRAEEYRGKIAEIGDVLAQRQGSAGIQGLIDSATQEQASIEFQRALAQGLIDQVNAAIPEETGNFSNFLQRSDMISDLTGGQITRVSALETTIEELGKQAESTAAQLFLYNEQLGSAEVLAQDAALAEQTRVNEYATSRAQFSQIEADTQRFLATATRQATDERVQAANDEIERLTALNEQLAEIGGETSAALIEENNARIETQYAIRRTTQALREEADTRNATRSAFTLVENVFGEGIRRFTGGIETVKESFESIQPAFETVAAITKAQSESSAKLAEIARQQSDAETKALNDRNQSLEDAALERYQSLEDQEREHKNNLLEINRRANATIANSIGERDALAAFLAQTARRDEVRQENRNNREALRRIDNTFKEQQRVIQRRYDEQLAAARSAAQRSAEIERARLQVQVDALNVQLKNQQTAAGLEIQIKGETNNAILQGAVNLRDNIINLFASAGSFEGDSSSNPLLPTVNYITVEEAQALLGLSGRAYGGAVNTGQRVLVGEHGPEIAYFRSPAMVMTNRASRSAGMGGDMPITLNMVGRSDSQIARLAGKEVEQYINRVMKAAKQKRGLS